MQHIRDVTDPEHPYTLEQLNVVSEDLVEANDLKSTVRYSSYARRKIHIYFKCQERLELYGSRVPELNPLSQSST